MDDRRDVLSRRAKAIETELADPAVWQDPKRMADLSRELREAEEILNVRAEVARVERELQEAKALLETEDPDLREMAEDEVQRLEAELTKQEAGLKRLLLPHDPRDSRDVIVEIRAGTGGDEAGLFAADLYRMYGRFAERQGWKVEVLEESSTTIGGIKEVVAAVKGRGAYSRLKYESGVHRVQRVPETEAQGRIHTSAATVAVLPEAEEVDVDIRPDDLRIDTYRSSGAGGQHVNKTDSAIRITHRPTGLVVTCQDEKSQHKNREKAMRVLRARLFDRAQQEASAEMAADRRSQIGSGDRSERIRTYNFPQGRLTDHRIGLTVYRLEAIMDGDLEDVIEALREAEEKRHLQ